MQIPAHIVKTKERYKTYNEIYMNFQKKGDVENTQKAIDTFTCSCRYMKDDGKDKILTKKGIIQ